MSVLKRRSAITEPAVWVGKNGVTKALLHQIEAQLDASEMIKIKVHQPSLEDKGIIGIASRIAAETGSEIIDTRGRTFSIYRAARKRGRLTRKKE